MVFTTYYPGRTTSGLLDRERSHGSIRAPSRRFKPKGRSRGLFCGVGYYIFRKGNRNLMGWKWFGVKTIFRVEASGTPRKTDDRFDPDVTMVEERVVLIRARSI